MNEKSRTYNSITNTMVGVVVQALTILLSFVTRVFFVRYLSKEYLGVNGLFSNILTVLSLAELGVGGAIIYSLYKPIADKNEEEIVALINFYRKAYFIIGLVILCIGVALIPLLPFLIKDVPDVPGLSQIYFLFLLNTVCSYWFAYRRVIFGADQRERILTKFKFAFTVIKAVLQSVALVLTRNYYLYLIIQIVCNIGENIFIHFWAGRYYPFLNRFRDAKLPHEKVMKLVTDVKSLMIYKIGSTALDGTDNIILSALVGVIWVGKLSNYTLIVSSIAALTVQVINSMTASVGNFIAKESESRREELLFRITFLSYAVYGFCAVCLSALMNPFVTLLFGQDYVLNYDISFVLSINYYIFGMMGSIWMFRTTMGLFAYGKFRPLVSAVLNIVISIVLAQQIGLIGVLLGTTITRLTTNVIYDPYLVYKYGLKKSPKGYYVLWLKYTAITVACMLLVHFIFRLMPTITIPVFILKCIICVSVYGSTLLLIESRNKEFLYFKGLILHGRTN